MIHAYLFVIGQPCGHGKEFKQKMKEINNKTGTNISTTHHFNKNAEVYFYRCDGPCRSREPEFGWVKTSNPRAPNPRGQGHARTCDGRFHRVYDTQKASVVSPTKIRPPNSSIFKDDDVKTNNANNHSSKAKGLPSTATKCQELNRSSAFDRSMSIKQEISEEWGGELNEIELITDFDVPITDEMFANYHAGQQKLLSVEFLNVKPKTSNDKNFCILCQLFVTDEQIYQHLFECSGCSADQIQYKLPFYRVPYTAV